MERPGNQEMNLTFRSTEVYSPRILCVLLVYDKIVNAYTVLDCLQSDFFHIHYFIVIAANDC